MVPRDCSDAAFDTRTELMAEIVRCCRVQVPGSHRFPTLTALGVLGGISVFDNAIQGALLGPILLSSIAVFFDLHVRLIAGLPASASSASLASLGRSRSASMESL